MEFDDPRWTGLRGGYGIPYDPRDVLRALEANDDVPAVWQELWNELHHQGDVGEASYAAVPHLVRIHAVRNVADWNTYALVATIELCRLAGRNPALPPELRGAYEAAWRRLVEIGLGELNQAAQPELIGSIIGVIAIAKGLPAMGRLVVGLTEDERTELIHRAGWL